MLIGVFCIIFLIIPIKNNIKYLKKYHPNSNNEIKAIIIYNYYKRSIFIWCRISSEYFYSQLL